MARQFLYMQWRAARMGLIPFIAAAFALPLLTVQGLGGITSVDPAIDAYAAVNAFAVFGPLFPFLAAAVGALLALSAWNWDHQGNHVYALSLPISRLRYSVNRFGAGVALAVVPTLALLLGALLASAFVSLPTGLEAYPFTLTFRFFVATLLAFSMLFAMASGTIRTTVIVLSVLVAGPFVIQLGLDALFAVNPAAPRLNIFAVVFDLVTAPGGPLRIFTGDWMLIDV